MLFSYTVTVNYSIKPIFNQLINQSLTVPLSHGKFESQTQSQSQSHYYPRIYSESTLIIIYHGDYVSI